VDIWFAPRNTANDSFSDVVNIGEPINTRYADGGLVVSADWPANGATVYFASNRDGGPGAPGTSGGTNLWQATWVAIPEGDYNYDGNIDAADYVVWRKGLGATYTQSDYDVWRANFGNVSLGVGAGSGAASPSAEPFPDVVPEPACGVLIILGLIASLTFVRNHRSR
jgi:hypothetical protein